MIRYGQTNITSTRRAIKMGHLIRNLNIKKCGGEEDKRRMRKEEWRSREFEKEKQRKLSTDDGNVQSEKRDSPYYPGKKESYYIIYESFQSHG